jgi:histidine triad (HIT) family protein
MSDPNCIFCKIVNKEIPAEIVFENENFLAFLDIHPQGAGHTQVIPKNHYRWVWDVKNPGEYFEVVSKIANAQREAFNTDWILSKIVGDEVSHAHIWVYPNSSDDMNDLKANAEKIRGKIN